MDSKLRKFVIGFISLAAVLAIYLLYGRVSKTPPVDTDAGAEFTDTVADSNLGVFDSKVGMIGEVGVETVRKARYIILNKNQEVEREWGFERLLHEVRDIWEIEKPYMNIYRRNFKCYITADIGKVRVETAVGKSTPKDATFTGNVVVHILPEGPGKIKESHIYLDDIIFLSEKSQLSTANSVKFVSEDAQMLGIGLELIYDDVLERLEYLRIVDLESLHIKSSQTGFLPGAKRQTDRSPDAGGPAEMQQPDEPAVVIYKGEVQPPVARPKVEQEKACPERSRRGEYYKCVFSKNVFIDSPEQLVFAHDEISINDIFWSKASSGQSSEADAGARTAETSQSNEADADAGTAEQARKGADDANTYNVAAEKQNEPNESPEKFEDIIVTCNNGFIIVPKDSPRTLENPAETNIAANDTYSRPPGKFDQAEGRTTFITRRIDYSAPTGDAVATGLSELMFYTGDITTAKNDEAPVPVKVTAQEGAKFFQASNQAIFEGCLCTMLREDPNVQQKYILSAPKLTIDMHKDTNEQSLKSRAGIEHLTADGGLVRLRTIKTAKQKLLGWIELESRKFDYDPGKGLFIATGPGIIRMDNSKITASGADAGKFSLRKPCYAFLREFDTLEYFIQENRIVADARSQRLLIDYFPVVNGKYGQQIKAEAGHVVALLTETAEGQTELSTMTTTGGIKYLDEENKNEFIGSELFYDHKKSVIKVRGDQLQPCYLNGALVDGIIYDLTTGKVEAQISAPGVLQLNR